MGLYLESWLNEFVAVALVAVAAVYAWYSLHFTYWSKRGVPQAQVVVPFGNSGGVFLGLTRMEFLLQKLYRRYRDLRYVGIYQFSKPALLLIDWKLIRLVLVKEFDAFADRNIEFNEKDPLSHNLFNLYGDRWKRLRTKMSPSFTTGKLKMMCQNMQDCGRELMEVLEEPAKKGQILEMRETAARFTTDVIASIAFGIECHSQRNPDEVFRQWGRKMFGISVKSRVAAMMYKFFPTVAKALAIKSASAEVAKYFRQVVIQNVELREKHDVVRNDFLQLMIQLKNKGFIEEEGKTPSQEAENWKFTINDVVAQAILFYAAGFETSSTTMSFALYELAINQHVQKRLQEELDATLKENAGELTYEAISNMKYLDKVVAETLRKHPPAGVTSRRCVRDIRLPDGGPLIEKGMGVFVPIYAVHYDPEYYPEPERFDPERFSEKQKAARPQYVYLPFGEGPRNCLGMRLGLLQTKIGLAYMLSKYEVHRCEATAVPLRYSTWSAVLAPTTDIQLKLVQRK